jgi:hypothetical protein
MRGVVVVASLALAAVGGWITGPARKMGRPIPQRLRGRSGIWSIEFGYLRANLSQMYGTVLVVPRADAASATLPDSYPLGDDAAVLLCDIGTIGPPSTQFSGFTNFRLRCLRPPTSTP